MRTKALANQYTLHPYMYNRVTAHIIRVIYVLQQVVVKSGDVI